jgi:hypothetical protein
VVTLNHALEALEKHIGFPQSRSTGIARRLQESKALPSGAPGVSPELDASDICLLIAVLASAPKLHEAVEHARFYFDATPGGANLDGAPDSISRSAIEALEIYAEMSVGGTPDAQSYVRSLKFEFVQGDWREMAVIEADSRAKRFRRVGELASHQGGPLRVAGVIQGTGFVDVMIELFRGTN